MKKEYSKIQINRENGQIEMVRNSRQEINEWDKKIIRKLNEFKNKTLNEIGL